MSYPLILIAALAGAVAAPLPAPSATPHPTEVVARSGRLVTTRTSAGGTQSFNCAAKANAERAVCRKR